MSAPSLSLLKKKLRQKKAPSELLGAILLGIFLTEFDVDFM